MGQLFTETVDSSREKAVYFAVGLIGVFAFKAAAKKLLYPAVQDHVEVAELASLENSRETEGDEDETQDRDPKAHEEDKQQEKDFIAILGFVETHGLHKEEMPSQDILIKVCDLANELGKLRKKKQKNTMERRKMEVVSQVNDIYDEAELQEQLECYIKTRRAQQEQEESLFEENLRKFCFALELDLSELKFALSDVAGCDAERSSGIQKATLPDNIDKLKGIKLFNKYKKMREKYEQPIKKAYACVENERMRLDMTQQQLSSERLAEYAKKIAQEYAEDVVLAKHGDLTAIQLIKLINSPDPWSCCEALRRRSPFG